MGQTFARHNQSEFECKQLKIRILSTCASENNIECCWGEGVGEGAVDLTELNMLERKFLFEYGRCSKSSNTSCLPKKPKQTRRPRSDCF